MEDNRFLVQVSLADAIYGNTEGYKNLFYYFDWKWTQKGSIYR